MPTDLQTSHKESPALALTMKAIRMHGYGGPDVLHYEDAPRPQPDPGEVLVRVHAAGVNPIDWRIRSGQTRQAIKHTFPLILGWDVSGVIEETGTGVRLKCGDEIYSRPDITRDGAYAEYMVIRETEVALKPKSIDHVHAAGIPVAALTAWQALFDAAQLQSGQTVLIHGAAGGVGGYAVQLAHWKGAHVIGTASAANADYVRALGADQVIDYAATRFETAVHDADVVLDTLGGDTQDRSWNVLRKEGVLVSTIAAPRPETAAAHGVLGIHIFTQPNPAQLTDMARLIDEGRLKSTVETVLPLQEARRAHELSQSGHQRGKIVLQVL